jgi:hypothetical protein
MAGLASTDIVRLDLGEVWIDAKAELCAGDMRRLRRCFIGVNASGGLEMKTDDPEQYSWELIKASVVDWSVTDNDGAKQPIDDDTIAALKDSTCNQIVAALNNLYKPISAAQKKA